MSDLSDRILRPFPEEAQVPGITAKLIASYRKAFDSDPGATFCAGEIDGVTIVLAVGHHGEQLQRFVERKWHAVIQRKVAP